MERMRTEKGQLRKGQWVTSPAECKAYWVRPSGGSLPPSLLSTPPVGLNRCLPWESVSSFPNVDHTV